MWISLYRLALAQHFQRFASTLIPWLAGLTAVSLLYGLVGGLYLAPADYQQGDAFRIIYIHVPSAFLSLAVYVFMASCALCFLIWRVKLLDTLAAASASLGAWFTFLALVTGAIWGKPMWGAWWVWDARLTSELILLFLYLGYIALRNAIPDNEQKARASSVLAVIGVVNIPIIHYSVYWWNTLHQGATLSRLARPAIDEAMLYPLLAMIVAFFSYFAWVLLLRVRNVIAKGGS